MNRVGFWLALVASIGLSIAPVHASWLGQKPRCELELTATEVATAPVRMEADRALFTLSQAFRGIEPQPGWLQVIDEYLLPAARSPSTNLVLTMIGGTNVGKSQVFNSLPILTDRSVETEAEPVTVHPSPVSFDAESTARPVIMANAGLFDEQGNFDMRFTRTERWRNPEQVASPGPALVYPVKDFFSNLIFVDTPAFTSPGTQADVIQGLRIADVFFYIFSNANYGEPSSLDFVRQRLEENGPRDIVLIYNVNAAIPPEVAETHFQYVREGLKSGFSPDTLPVNIMAAYHMIHSEKVARGEEGVQFLPFADSIPFEELLVNLEANSATHRRQSLNLTLKYVLEKAKQSIAEINLLEGELDVTEKIFDAYLNHLIRDAVLNIPYHRLGPDLEKAYYRQTTGFRKFSQWLANPLNMSGLFEGPSPAKSPAVREIERYLDSVIEKVIAEFRLGVAEGIIRIPTDDDQAPKVLEDINQFRKRFSVGEEGPSYQKTNGFYEIQLPRSKTVQLYFDRFLARDWHTLVPEIKKDVRENFANLILQIQSRLDELARKQSFAVRAKQGVYTTLAIAPALMAVTYMAYRGTAILEIQTLASIFGAHLAARLFVSLNESSFRRGWAEAIRSWLEERQEPRLSEILRRHIRLRPTEQRVQFDRARVSQAIDDLYFSGIGTR